MCQLATVYPYLYIVSVNQPFTDSIIHASNSTFINLGQAVDSGCLTCHLKPAWVHSYACAPN